MKIALISVAYNRVDSLKRQFASLERAVYPEPVTLIVSIDKSKTDSVEQFADSYKWPHGELRVVKHEKNLGLRAHMLSLEKYFDEFDAIVVLEDDITVATSFYYYVKACVEKYYNHPQIAGISLYNFSVNYQTYLPFTPAKSDSDVYLMNCAQSWGEVWMRPQWQMFKEWYDNHAEAFNLEHLPKSLNDWPSTSWLKYHTRYCIEEDKYFVYPYTSLSTNNADAGVNVDSADTLFQAELQATLKKTYELPSFEDCEIRYDGFFQPRFLAKYLQIDEQTSMTEENLCVDIFSEKPACLYRRYVLSDRCLPYKLKTSFALQQRPVEMNIINHIEGNELWLYDTAVSAQPPASRDRYTAFYYLYKKAFYKVRTMVGWRRSISLLTKLVNDKLKQKK